MYFSAVSQPVCSRNPCAPVLTLYLTGFFIAMIAHDYLQEGISLHPDFNFYVLLTFTEFFFCTLGPAVVHVAGGKPTSALNTTPITSFVKLGATIFLAAALANLSLQFVQVRMNVR